MRRGEAWYPEQKLTLDEAVAAFTTGAAYAVGEERATLRRADLTIFDGPLTGERSRAR